jgi:hypothetical protein
MILHERGDRNPGDIEAIAVFQDMRYENGLVVRGGVLGQGFEHIPEAIADDVEGFRVGVGIQRRLEDPVDGAKIVDAVKMVGVKMGEKDGVEAVDPGSQKLFP